MCLLKTRNECLSVTTTFPRRMTGMTDLSAREEVQLWVHMRATKSDRCTLVQILHLSNLSRALASLIVYECHTPMITLALLVLY